MQSRRKRLFSCHKPDKCPLYEREFLFLLHTMSTVSASFWRLLVIAVVVLAEDMGNLVSRIQGFCGRRTITEAFVIMIGIDGGGKTTILYRLKLNKVVETISTIGYNAESLDIVDDMPLLVWDVGLGVKGWPLLRQYLSGCNGFVFVVDSTDTERFQEAKENLFMLLDFTEIVDIPFIVLANKQDLEGSCSPSEVAQLLDLERIQYNKWAMFGCSGLTGEGVKEALEKLCTMIKEHRSLTIRNDEQ